MLKYLKGLHGEGASFNYAEGEGGGSGFYEMMSLRAPSEVFTLSDATGRSYWPENVNRQLLNPYYDITEKMLNVHQMPEDKVPKNGQIFASMIKNLGYSTDRINYAAKNCMQCGRCVTGCIYGAKQSMMLTYLPRAKSAGMHFLADTDAQHIRPVKSIESAPDKTQSMEDMPFRYTVLCRHSGEEDFEITCKYIVLGAGTIGTAKVLLQSREELPKLSRHIGQHVSFNGSVKMAALIPDALPDGDLFTGRSHPGVMSFEFLKSHGMVLTTAKPLPLQIFAAARISRFSDGEFGYLGADHVDLMQKMRHRMMFLIAFGNLPTNATLTLGKENKMNLNKPITDIEMTLYEKGKSLLTHVAEENGAEVLDLQLMSKEGLPHEKLHFTSAHQLGSCRMSERPEDGVVNSDGEVYGYPGMYIADGSVLPTSLIIGPSLTIAANAERIAHRLLQKLNLIAPEFNEVAHGIERQVENAII